MLKKYNDSCIRFFHGSSLCEIRMFFAELSLISHFFIFSNGYRYLLQLRQTRLIATSDRSDKRLKIGFFVSPITTFFRQVDQVGSSYQMQFALIIYILSRSHRGILHPYD